MVFCNLISVDEGKLVYAVGGTTNDITGELMVNLKDGSFSITKEPKKTKVYPRHISAMLRRSQDDFEKGVFHERLSYEI